MAGYNTNWFEVMQKKAQRKKRIKKYSMVTARQVVSVLMVDRHDTYMCDTDSVI